MDKYLTLKDASEELGKSEDTIRRHVQRLKRTDPSLIGTKILEEAISSGHFIYRVDIDFLRKKLSKRRSPDRVLTDLPMQEEEVHGQNNKTAYAIHDSKEKKESNKQDVPGQNGGVAQADEELPMQKSDSAHAEDKDADVLPGQTHRQEDKVAHAEKDLHTQDQQSAHANGKSKEGKKGEAGDKQFDDQPIIKILQSTVDVLTNQLSKKDEQLGAKDKQIDQQGNQIEKLINSKEHSDLIIASLGARLGLIEPGKSAEEVIKKVEAEEIVDAEVVDRPADKTSKNDEEKRGEEATKKVKSQVEDEAEEDEDRDFDEDNHEKRTGILFRLFGKKRT